MVVPWLVLAALIVTNALYVMAEFSAVAVPRSRLAQLAEEGHPRAGRLLAVLDDGIQLDRYIAACQIGITLSSLIAGAYGQATIALDLAPRLAQWFGLSVGSAHSTAALVVLIVLTGLQVVLGELVPKSLALQFPERAALATFVPTRWSASIFRGFIWLLNGSGFLLLKPFKVTPGGHQHVHSPEEIGIMISESQRGGALGPEMSRRLHRGLRLSGRTVHELMVSREDVYAIEASTPPDAILQKILTSPYSRIPIYRGSLDHVLGAVSIKDVVGIYAERGAIPRLADLVRPIPFVLATTRADQFVRFLEQQRSSKAVVVDANGRVQGFASIEDVLGELFGDIGDELKSAEPDFEGRTPVPEMTDQPEEVR